MELIPAIDLLGGRVLRLRRGDFGEATFYPRDPVDLARDYAARGARRLHLVDLDGARAGRPVQLKLAARIAAAAGIPVQLGGGLRRTEDLEAAFAAGIGRAVVGSAALAAPERLAAWIARFGAERIVLALDVRGAEARVAVAAWTADSGLRLDQALGRLLPLGARRLLVTAIERDGTLLGPDLALYRRLRAEHPALLLQASGGVRDRADLEALAALGVEGAVVGKALLEERVRLEEAPC